MSNTGLSVFDHTLYETNHWLRQIMDRMHTNDRHRAFTLLRNVLHVIRDCLTAEDSAHFSAQLPMLIRGVYFEGWQPGRIKKMRLTRKHVLERVAHELGAITDELDAGEVVTAVLDTILDNVDPGEGDKVLGKLPSVMQELWLTGDAD